MKSISSNNYKDFIEQGNCKAKTVLIKVFIPISFINIFDNHSFVTYSEQDWCDSLLDFRILDLIWNGQHGSKRSPFAKTYLRLISSRSHRWNLENSRPGMCDVRGTRASQDGEAEAEVFAVGLFSVRETSPCKITAKISLRGTFTRHLSRDNEPFLVISWRETRGGGKKEEKEEEGRWKDNKKPDEMREFIDCPTHGF